MSGARSAVYAAASLAIAAVVLYGHRAAAFQAGDLASLAQAKRFEAARVSSYDRSGGNADGGSDRPLRPGETRVLADLKGAGAITHLWFTFATKDRLHLKHLVLRAYWDGEAHPSIEAPIGDFFGLGHGRYYQYWSTPIQIGEERGLNCYWRMPFSRRARFTITNDGPLPVVALYYYVDYERHRAPAAGALRFHAQYRQAYPCPPDRNYEVLAAAGPGHYVGCSLSIHNRAGGWWGEGDDMIYVDGAAAPTLHGTGSEDYFCGGWAYGEQGVRTFHGPNFGCPFNEGGNAQNALWNVYRYHIHDPVPFKRSLRVTLEHGHKNNRSDDFSSVAFWYQSEPHAPFAPLPRAADRLPGEATVFVEPYALEAEVLAPAFASADVTAEETLRHGNQWSGGKHLAFKPAGPGVFRATVPTSRSEAGVYGIEWWVTAGPDYGLCEVWFNGVRMCSWDGYAADGLTRRKVPEAGTLTVRPSGNVMEVRVVGKNPASGGYRAGLDCWLITPR